MILGVLIIAAIQTFLLFSWNEPDGPFNWLREKVALRCPKMIYKPIIECLICQSWWMSVLSTGIMIGYYCNFVMILILPLLWITTLLMYRHTFE